MGKSKFTVAHSENNTMINKKQCENKLYVSCAHLVLVGINLLLYKPTFNLLLPTPVIGLLLGGKLVD